MELEGWKGKLYWFVEWITLLAVLQLLWTGLTLLGLLLFGVAPATVAMFTTLRKRLQGEDDLKRLVKIYWNTYKVEFIPSNKIGMILLSIGYFLTINFQIVSSLHGLLGLLLLTAFISISILFGIIVVNIFQLYAHYDLPTLRYFAASIIFSIAYPLQMISNIVGLMILYKIYSWFPGLIPFFGVSLAALFLTWMSSHIFKHEREAEKHTNLPHYSAGREITS
ncbi:DUF624 domain-containing protein [Lysinibacillus sp. FSL R7-0073]|uniref:YesL family protein n=1 Tax=Lysinibacillus TaxID=400634 RepID=UPI00215A16D8|nr:DUF624 domain-containing protein [Lysinibacillus fusiformis]MCR8851294.1 DUF624 domain-containing protein [Lysinibacillus fusiformis]WKT77822.1 DUF624 domain-containing protein [Lysinibacillus fusiformis]